MRKILTVLAVSAVLAFASTPAVFAGLNDLMSYKAGEFNLNSWIGTDVVNKDGEYIGEIKDFVHDDDGTVIAAILSFDDRDVAVPYVALTLDDSKDQALLDATMDQLASAPDFDLSGRASLEEVYTHFGQRPYWDEHLTPSDRDSKEYVEGMSGGH